MKFWCFGNITPRRIIVWTQIKNENISTCVGEFFILLHFLNPSSLSCRKNELKVFSKIANSWSKNECRRINIDSRNKSWSPTTGILVIYHRTSSPAVRLQDLYWHLVDLVMHFLGFSIFWWKWRISQWRRNIRGRGGSVNSSTHCGEHMLLWGRQNRSTFFLSKERSSVGKLAIL